MRSSRRSIASVTSSACTRSRKKLKTRRRSRRSLRSKSIMGRATSSLHPRRWCMGPLASLSSSNPLEQTLTIPQLVLGADVGGTNSKLALARYNDRFDILKRHVYPSGSFATLELVIESFLAEPDVVQYGREVSAAC